MRTARPARLTTFDYLGPYRYFLTFCTHFRERLFVDAESVDLVWSQIVRAATEGDFSVIAYCFMPDHVHFLVEGRTGSSDCRKFIKTAKQYAGYAFSTRRRKRLWQPWGYERVLRDEESTVNVARYILENPVRAGLVRQVSEYPFVGSQVCSVKDLLDGLPIGRADLKVGTTSGRI